jgi:hypothetical protein
VEVAYFEILHPELRLKRLRKTMKNPPKDTCYHLQKPNDKFPVQEAGTLAISQRHPIAGNTNSQALQEINILFCAISV